MLLQWILDRLDAELSRLLQLRAVVAELEAPSPGTLTLDADAVLIQNSVQSTVAAPEIEPLPPDADEVAPPALAPTRVASRKSRVVRARRTPEAAVIPALPVGPVVVSAAALQKERAERGSRIAKPTPLEGSGPLQNHATPDTAARLLSARWLAGARAEGPPNTA